MKTNDRKLLIRIAQMYYEKNMTQSQIAGELGVNRTTISRMLKKVRDEGIVKITIHYESDGNVALEQQLKECFGLKEAVVVPVEATAERPAKLRAVGQAAAQLISQLIEEGAVIGFSWGTSLAASIEALEPEEKRRGVCVPLIGGPAGKLDSRYHVNTICYQAAQKFGMKSLMIDAPAILEKKEICDEILTLPHLEEIRSYWERLSVAVFGIGSLEIANRPIWRSFYGNQIIRELEQKKVAGDICSRFFNHQGSLIQTSLTGRTLSIPLTQLKKVPHTIGVAESLEKVSGLIGALNGGYMNTLITTEETALAILEQTK